MDQQPNFPSFDELFREIETYNETIRLWQNIAQPSIMYGKYKSNLIPNNNTIIKSSGNNYASTELYLTIPKYAGTGVHISIRKDTWDSHKLIHLTVYYIQNNNPQECGTYFTLYFENNNLKFKKARHNIDINLPRNAKFDITGLNNDPPIVTVKRAECKTIIQLGLNTIKNSVFVNPNTNAFVTEKNQWNAITLTDTYPIRDVMFELLKAFGAFILDQPLLKLQLHRHKLSEAEKELKVRIDRKSKTQQEKSTSQQGIKRVREEKPLQNQPLQNQPLQNLPSENPNPSKRPNDNTLEGGSYDYKYLYMKYKKKYLSLKKLNI
ncbi:hypothetical protein Indivirus_1_105 [Indivirus ILV1]|uniref:Uncharacterized protein n=1 Tax=Indivirus ILV1 TaxID=1977633 RepID=A0A1V0SCP2_9VIRU|nr:hypothetical protein Indivirus_1_105 [Indivirus ILV1]